MTDQRSNSMNDLEFYSITADNKYRCRCCETQGSDFSVSSIASLRRHIRRKHPEVRLIDSRKKPDLNKKSSRTARQQGYRDKMKSQTKEKEVEKIIRRAKAAEKEALRVKRHDFHATFLHLNGFLGKWSS